MAQITEMRANETILAMVLANIKANVISGINQAKAAGVACEMPTTIEVEIPIDANGLPCIEALRVGRVKTVIHI